MPAIEIKIENTVGGDKVARLLRAMEPRTMLDAIGNRFLGYIDESFRTRGRGRWAPLAASTLELRQHGGDAPLQDTGKYKQSFTPARTDGQTYVEVGSNRKTPSGIPLINIHEFGTGPFTIGVRTAKVLAARTRAGGWMIFGKTVNHPGIPARPVLPDERTAEKLVQDTTDALLQRAIDKGAA